MSNAEYATRLFGSAVAGVAIGYVASKLDEFQRKVLAPYISKRLAEKLREKGLIKDDIQQSKFFLHFEKFVTTVL